MSEDDRVPADGSVLVASGPPPGRGVYCNRTLNLRSIQVIGYDMDYTLVHYHVVDWERSAYDHLQRRMSADGFPVEGLAFDAELVTRGVIIDTELGNLLKANRFGYVKTAYHGTERMDYDRLRTVYMRTPVDLSDTRFRFLNTLFALSEASMYAQLVDRLDEGAFDDGIGYQDLYRIVRSRLDQTHMMGRLKAEIMRDPERFVERDPDTIPTLLDQRRAGKRLLLITNSGWTYTDAMMRFICDGALPPSMGGWRELFDVTVVAARKPAFFDGDAPLLRVVDDDGRLEPHIVGPLEPHGAYFGGHAAVLQDHLGVSEDEILYLGDHMYGDVHASKDLLRWRTGLILRELEEELRVVEETHAEQRELALLMQRKEALEYRQCQLKRLQLRARVPADALAPAESGAAAATQVDVATTAEALAEVKRELIALDEQIAPLAIGAGKAHNPRWGLLMRAGNDKSQLARQIERWADVYTSRVSNLLHQTPFAYLRSRRGSLPHDPLRHLDAPPVSAVPGRAADGASEVRMTFRRGVDEGKDEPA
ncbi:MAG: HAD-IG family 5'-nucleotidase [Myxococcota bacterium]